MRTEDSNVYDPSPVPVDSREDKLPSWARDIMARLRQQAETSARVANKASLSRKPDGAFILLDPHSEAPIGLDDVGSGRPRRTEIAFLVPHRGYPGGRSKICVKLLPDGSGIEVRGDEALVIEPRVTNSIRVSNKRD